MSSGGSKAPSYQDAGVSQSELSSFMNTEEGKKYANSYDPRFAYMQSGNSYFAYDPKNPSKNSDGTMQRLVGLDGQTADPTAMIAAFKEWQSGNNQTQQSWESYAKAVSANEGGQGDQTITTGAGVGQRQQLLGALANAGNPGTPATPTTPTPGLGAFGVSASLAGRMNQK